MYRFVQIFLSSKKDETTVRIEKLSKEEFIKESDFLENFTEFFKKYIPYNTYNAYDIFSKYIITSTRDYRIKIYLLNLVKLKLEKKIELNDLEVNNLKLKLEKTLALVDIKNNEINKLNSQISKKEYNYINNLKRKKFNQIKKKESSKSRKRRRINRSYNKLLDNVCKSFEKDPKDLIYLYNSVKNN